MPRIVNGEVVRDSMIVFRCNEEDSRIDEISDRCDDDLFQELAWLFIGSRSLFPEQPANYLEVALESTSHFDSGPELRKYNPTRRKKLWECGVVYMLNPMNGTICTRQKHQEFSYAGWQTMFSEDCIELPPDPMC